MWWIDRKDKLHANENNLIMEWHKFSVFYNLFLTEVVIRRKEEVWEQTGQADQVDY